MTRKGRLTICPKCGASVKPENYSRHMETVHGISTRRTKAASILVASIALLGLVGGVWIYTTMFGSTPAAMPTLTSSGKPGESVVRILTSELSTSAKWYTYNSGGVNVRYFLVKGGDGKIHLATDACDVCYTFKRGYRQTGAVMTCNNCGQTFAINGIGTDNLTGGCWPSYIPMRIEGEYVVIKTSDLDKKRFMFT